MAQLALGVVGAAAGFVIGGGPMGAAIGFSLGTAVGGLLFPPEQPTREGGRINDLAISGSTYGVPIVRIFGSVRLPGNLIWSTPLKETRTKSKVGGKGLGGGAKVVNYTYSSSFAVAFCTGECERLVRLWFDNKLVLDVTGTTTPTAVSGLKMRFYTGSETQEPDPAMAAAMAEGTCPAYRGLCYAVFEDLELAAYGNRPPNITAEITRTSTPYLVHETATPLGVTSASALLSSWTYKQDALAVDWTRNRAYRLARGPLKAGGGTANVLAVQDLTTLVETRHVRLRDDSTYPSALCCDQGGDVYYAAAGAVVRLNGETLAEVDAWGPTVYGGSGHIWPDGAGFTIEQLCAAGAVDPSSGERVVFVCGVNQLHRAFVLDGVLMVALWGTTRDADNNPVADAPDPFGGTYGAAVILPGEVQQVRLVFWIVEQFGGATPGQTLHLHKLRCQYAGASTPDLIDDVEFTRDVAEVPFADAMGTHTTENASVRRADYVVDDDALVLSTQWRLLKWAEDRGTVWSVELEAGGGPIGGGRLSGQYYGLGSESPRMYDLDTGALVYEGEYPDDLVPAYQYETWDGLTWRSIGLQLDQLLHRYLYNRATQTPHSLSAVVEEICGLAGIGEDELDTAELDGDLVQGAVFSQSTARDFLQRLQPAFLFDAAESGGLLVFRKRGRAPVLTVPYTGVLKGADGGGSFSEVRTQALELPRRVTVRYRDVARDQLQGAQSWARPLAPTPTVPSVGESALDLPLVMTADHAKSIARTAVAAAWTERTRLDDVPLPASHLALEPGDVVLLGTRDGASLRLRLGKLDIGADFALKGSGVTEAPAVYSFTATADPGEFPAQTIGAAGTALLVLADMPLLRDMDETFGTGLRAYAAGAANVEGWRGGSLYRSPDGTTWAFQVTIPTGSAWGYATSAVPAPASPWSWDTETEIAFIPVDGAERFEAATDLEVLNGANGAALVLADGSVEIVQFVEAEHAEDGTITLSRLLRGRRGTEDACGADTGGALVLLLEADALAGLVLGASDQGALRQWRLQGRGETFELLPDLPRTLHGRAEMPYAPVHLAAERDGSDNLTITWVRRTRYGGEWTDGTGTVPLGEESEAYEVDVLDGPDGAVVRTITGLSTAEAEYSAADQTSDFGGPQAEVNVRVFQMSALVGRGVGAEAAL